MPEPFNTRVLTAFELFAWISSVGAVLLAGSVLLGWMTGSQMLKAGVPGLTSMSPLTALGFALAGASLRSHKARYPAASRACAVLLLLVCAAIMASYLATGRDALNPAIEHGLGLLRGGPEGLTAPSTLAGFAVLAGALLSLERPDQMGGWLLLAFAAPGLLISGLALLGYAYRARQAVDLSSIAGKILGATATMRDTNAACVTLRAQNHFTIVVVVFTPEYLIACRETSITLTGGM